MSEETNISTNNDSGKRSPRKELSSVEILRLIAFVGVLSIPYVYNSHQSDKKHRQSEKVKSELKELRAEYITLKSEIVGQNKQSDVSKKLESRGLKPLSEAPINLNTLKE